MTDENLRHELLSVLRQLANPPGGWFTLGTHVDQAIELEFWGSHGGTPIWERPVTARMNPFSLPDERERARVRAVLLSGEARASAGRGESSVWMTIRLADMIDRLLELEGVRVKK